MSPDQQYCFLELLGIQFPRRRVSANHQITWRLNSDLQVKMFFRDYGVSDTLVRKNKLIVHLLIPRLDCKFIPRSTILFPRTPKNSISTTSRIGEAPDFMAAELRSPRLKMCFKDYRASDTLVRKKNSSRFTHKYRNRIANLSRHRPYYFPELLRIQFPQRRALAKHQIIEQLNSDPQGTKCSSKTTAPQIL